MRPLAGVTGVTNQTTMKPQSNNLSHSATGHQAAEFDPQPAAGSRLIF